MKYIDSEIILNRKGGSLIYVYIMIIIVIILSLIIFFILCHYRVYYDTRGVVIKEDSYYIRVYVPIQYMKYITDNNIVKIGNNEYLYEIMDIDSEFFNDNVNTYQIVKIIVDIDEKYKFNNLTLNLKFLKYDKKIIDYIFD